MSSFPVPASMIRSLANLLRASRQKAGLTRQQVAESTELYTEVYGRIERAGMMPTVPTLQRICVALNVDYQSLVDSMRRYEKTPED